MTELQQSLIEFIATHTEVRGESPSLIDIGHGFQSRPNASLLRSLEALVALGQVRLVHGRWQISTHEAQLHFDLTERAPAGSPLQ